MAPKRGKNKSGLTALPGGTELEALAWGYHTAKGVRGDRIAGLVNNATEELLSGTGQAQWAVHVPDLGVQLPASRQTVIESVGEAQLAAAFAGSARRKHVYNPLSTYDQDQALKALSGASGSRSAYGTGSMTFPDGSILTNAKSFKGQTPEAKAKRASRAAAAVDKPLAVEDGGGTVRKLFRPEPLRRRDATPRKEKVGRVAIPEVAPVIPGRVAIPETAPHQGKISDEDMGLYMDEILGMIV